ncbi:hypothetical protein C0J52_09714, partial [Blattella germanica]
RHTTRHQRPLQTFNRKNNKKKSISIPRFPDNNGLAHWKRSSRKEILNENDGTDQQDRGYNMSSLEAAPVVLDTVLCCLFSVLEVDTSHAGNTLNTSFKVQYN